MPRPKTIKILLLSNKRLNLILRSKAGGAPEKKERILRVCSVNFEAPDNALCSACHDHPPFHGAWII